MWEIQRDIWKECGSKREIWKKSESNKLHLQLKRKKGRENKSGMKREKYTIYRERVK